MPLTQKMLPGLLENASREATANRENQLRQYLQAQEPEIAGQKQTAQNEANLKTLQSGGLQDLVNSGGSAKVGDIALGGDPYSKMQGRQTSGDAQARLKANQIYNQGLPKIQGIAQAAGEGLDLANDPQNIGSLGQARTLMLKAMGMNRYNEQEAKAVLPASLQGHLATMFNSAGADLDPLNDVQRSSINQFFKGQLDNAAIQHKQLKQNAMNVYSTSPYASEMGLQVMGAMGSPVEQAMTQSAAKYKDIAHTKGPNLTPQPNPGPVDRLKQWWAGAHGQPAAASSPKGPMSFEDWKKANGR